MSPPSPDRLRRIAPLAASLAVLGCVDRSAPEGSQRRTLDLDWIHGPEAAAVSEMPRHRWTREGELFLYDPEAPPARRGLVRVDLTTGRRVPVADTRRALAQLDTLAPGARSADAEPCLPWPLAILPDGAGSLYRFDEDLFLLDHGSSTFRRLTDDPLEEKEPRPAPDGRYVAFVRENDLHVVELGSGAERRLTRDGTPDLLNGTLSWVYWEEIFGREDTGFWWSPDGSRIAFLQSDESAVDVSVFVDYEPATPRVVRQRYPKAGSINPTVRVGIVDVATGEIAWAALAGHEYVLRVAWAPDGSSVFVQTMPRDQRSLDLWQVPPDGLSPRLVLRETDPAWVNESDDLRILSDGRLLWTSERSGYRHLYLLAPDGSELACLTEGEWALKASTDEGSSVAAVDEEGGWVYVTGLLDSTIERHLYRVPLAGGAPPERVSEGAGTHRVSFSPDARHYVDRHSDIGTPPGLRLHSTEGGPAHVLQVPRIELLAGLDLVVPRFLTLEARDGFELPAWILAPHDLDPARPRPLILYVYGGASAPVVQNAWSDSLLFDNLLLRSGYLVARIDNRSAAGISKRLENTVLLRYMADGELDDLVDGVRGLKALPGVDPERVGVWGWSGGGSATLNLMTGSREFRAGVAVAAVTDWRYYDTRYTEFAMKTPSDNPVGYANALASRAASLHGRLLLVHGTYDDNVHPQNALRFVDELVGAGIPFDLMIYPMRKHGMRRAEDDDGRARRHLFAKMLEHWRLYL